jgi:hypothetical protein
VIDILQQYTFKKRAAKILKGLVHDATKLSTIEVGHNHHHSCWWTDKLSALATAERSRLTDEIFSLLLPFLETV